MHLLESLISSLLTSAFPADPLIHLRELAFGPQRNGRTLRAQPEFVVSGGPHGIGLGRCDYCIELSTQTNLCLVKHSKTNCPPDFTIMAGYSFGEHTLELHS
jgi:hypothetical protein